MFGLDDLNVGVSRYLMFVQPDYFNYNAIYNCRERGGGRREEGGREDGLSKDHLKQTYQCV